MARGAHQVMVHLDRFSVMPANGDKCAARSLGVPSVQDQTRVVLCVNDGELAPCKRDQSLAACAACEAVCGVLYSLAKAYNVR
jgi:hypothetical protein